MRIQPAPAPPTTPPPWFRPVALDDPVPTGIAPTGTAPTGTGPAVSPASVVGGAVPGTGGYAFVSGQVPFDATGQLVAVGRLGAEVDLATGVRCARQCASNLLAALARSGVDLDRVRLLKLTVFVASAPDFTAQPQVADGASELLAEVLGERGRHARSAVGVAALPLGAPVEIELIARTE